MLAGRRGLFVYYGLEAHGLAITGPLFRLDHLAGGESLANGLTDWLGKPLITRPQHNG
jgi:hypothetical protein